MPTRLKPVVDIQRLAPNTYAYSVGTAGGHSDGGAFESLSKCLFDAGASLGEYFSQVELKFEGVAALQCDTASMRRNPEAVAARLRTPA